MVSCRVHLLILSLVTFIISVYGSITAFTSLGPVEGAEYITDGGRVVSAFMGVPYAKPPIGKYRFERARPMEKWSGTWMGNQPSPPCLQIKTQSQKVEGSEDCLYLNIFTPSLLSNSSLPVIIYIHGGSFLAGQGYKHGPKFLLDSGDFVMVNINYRLGPFGFLSTEDNVVPGNNGLKDQITAFKWVKDNIAAFGGDHRKVTIAGNSAGGASVHLHYFSSLSRGLFTKGISSSGCALNPWVLTEKPLQKAKILAASLGCPTNNTTLMVSCLKQRPGQQIFLFFIPLFMPWVESPFTAFGPVIELFGTDRFLSEHPYKMLLNGKFLDVPWLVSITTDEGLYPSGHFIDREDKMKELANGWDSIGPHLMDYNFTVSPDKKNIVSNKIKSFYFFNQNKFLEISQVKLIAMLGDRHFKADIGNAVRLQASAQNSPVFLFLYNYRANRSLSDYFTTSKANFGVSHCDDIFIIFGINKIMTKSDKTIALIMSKIWLNFVNFDDPSPSSDIQWSSVGSSHDENVLNYFYITSATDMGMLNATDFGNFKFWNSLELMENANYNYSIDPIMNGVTHLIIPITLLLWSPIIVIL